MYLKNHLLAGKYSGRTAHHLHCDKHCGRLLRPDTIVLHYTGGADAISSAHHLARPDTDASAHIVIARDGGIIQLLPFNTIAWHAGKSEYEGRTNLNRYSIGIEMDNAGQLHRRGDRFYSWFKREYMPDEVYTHCENGQATYWHNYTLAQIQSVFAVCKLLLLNYPIQHIVGHSDISSRKIDPGPAFPMEKFRHQLLLHHTPHQTPFGG
ncbi:N-acetylmuramoyl-L-alanine amidase [Odoribacter lunatus]|uniref:N-acetylmuramoyl-L-alanine amidase n=1 Tax=Odoribacter lunatus TaxID=2941335 RepID=UPI00203BF826|nr:N-acetylmuramoyl-L-alanine amidase [Odoribacter lunatus]